MVGTVGWQAGNRAEVAECVAEGSIRKGRGRSCRGIAGVHTTVRARRKALRSSHSGSRKWLASSVQDLVSDPSRTSGVRREIRRCISAIEVKNESRIAACRQAPGLLHLARGKCRTRLVVDRIRNLNREGANRLRLYYRTLRCVVEQADVGGATHGGLLIGPAGRSRIRCECHAVRALRSGH